MRVKYMPKWYQNLIQGSQANMEDTQYCLIEDDKIVKGPCYPPRYHDGIKDFDRQPNNVLSSYGWIPVNVPILGDNQKMGELVLRDGWVDQLAVDKDI